MKRKIFFLLGILFFYLNLFSQVKTLEDSITSLFVEQVSVYPQEKNYINTDRSNYVSGERIWFRVFLCDAIFNKQANASRYLYVELLNPLGVLEQKIKIKSDSLGLFYGHLDLEENQKEGDYTLCSYTEYMKNLGESYYCKKRVKVLNPSFEKIDLSLSFDLRSELDVTLSCTDKYSGVNVTVNEAFLKFSENDTKQFRKHESLEDVHCLLNAEKYSGKNALLSFNVNGYSYSKYVNVPFQKRNYDINFFPEGGHYLFEDSLRVGVKIVNADGFGEAVKGVLKDENGSALMEFTTNKMGIGSFAFLFKRNEKYFVDIKNSKNEIQTKELILNNKIGPCSLATHWINDSLFVSIKKNIYSKLNTPLYLIIHSRGVPLYNKKIEDVEQNICFMNHELPLGVSHIILYTSDRVILSERLIFNRNFYQLPKVKVNTDKENYKARELIKGYMHLTDYNNEPMPGDFSVSVIDNFNSKIEHRSNILSHLLLVSEVKGYIESPSYYFRSDGINNFKDLDNLMLTQGWRRYSIPNVLKGEVEKPKFDPELGLSISGKVYGKYFKSGKKAKVKLIAIKNGVADVQQVQADDKGDFIMSNLNYPDSTLYILEALTNKEKKGAILTLNDTYKKNNYMELKPLPLANDNINFSSFIKQTNDMYLLDHGIRMIDLDEISVTAKRLDNKSITSSYYSPLLSSNLLSSDDFKKRNITSMSSLLSHLGVFVTGNKVMIRNQVAQIIIDDIACEDDDVFNALIFDDIENAFVLKDGIGVVNMRPSIVFTTKRGEGIYSNVISDNIKSIKPLGYQQTVEFYSPVYTNNELLDNDTPDLRSTIYWNPRVLVDKQGDASFEFYTADPVTTYTIVIEGVSADGHVFFEEFVVDRSEQ